MFDERLSCCSWDIQCLIYEDGKKKIVQKYIGCLANLGQFISARSSPLGWFGSTSSFRPNKTRKFCPDFIKKKVPKASRLPPLPSFPPPKKMNPQASLGSFLRFRASACPKWCCEDLFGGKEMVELTWGPNIGDESAIGKYLLKISNWRPIVFVLQSS